MNTPNIKVYLVVSGILIVLFLFVTFYPFGRKSVENQQPITNYPTPTLIEINNTSVQPPIVETADSTGVFEEELPPDVLNLSIQKQSLRNNIPLDTGLFQIDFDYAEDKFIVTLADPKAENNQQFSQWLKDNYPALSINQFNFR